jgi:hypothetical protein
MRARDGYGSARDGDAFELTAEKLTSKLRGRIAAGHDRQRPATSGRPIDQETASPTTGSKVQRP